MHAYFVKKNNTQILLILYVIGLEFPFGLWVAENHL